MRCRPPNTRPHRPEAQPRPHALAVPHALALMLLGSFAPGAPAQISTGIPTPLSSLSASSLGQGGVTVARSASGVSLAVWSDDRTGDHDVYGALISATGVVMSPIGGFRIAGGPAEQGDPRVAACGDVFLVVWGNGVNDGTITDLFATRVNRLGFVLDQSPIVIANGPGVEHNSRQPASDGNDIVLVPFRDATPSVYAGISAMRISMATGTPMDPPGGIVIAPADPAEGIKKNPSATHGAGKFLVTWDDSRDGCVYPNESGCIDIYGAMVDPITGVVVTPPFSASRAFSCQEGSRAGFDGVNFLVAQQDERLTNCSTADIMALRVSSAGQPLDPVDPTGMVGGLSVALDPNGYPGTIQSGAVVLAGPRQHVISYADQASTASTGALRVRRLDADGSIEYTDSRAAFGSQIVLVPPSSGVTTRAEFVHLVDETYLAVYPAGNRAFARTFTFLTPLKRPEFAGIEWCRGVAIDAAGNNYVTEPWKNRIHIYDRNGVLVRKFGSFGVGTGQFQRPYGVAINAAGELFVLDTGNNRVQVFNSSGTFKLAFGRSGIGRGQFNFPLGFCIDSSSNVYVADTNNDRVQVFSPQGQLKFIIGSSGVGRGQFKAPRAVAIDRQGRIFVADRDNNRVQVFTSAGVFSSVLNLGLQLSAPRGIAFDSTDRIYIVDSGNNRIVVADPLAKGGQTRYVFGARGNSIGRFSFAAAIAIDANDSISICDGDNNRLQRFGPIP